MTIKNKIVIITGASKGIGKATAKLLVEKGAKVVLAARSKDALKELEKELPGSLAVPTDMCDEKDIDRLIEKTVKKFGRIDVLINNAGQGIYSAIESVDVSAYKNVIELNVIAPLIAMQKVIPIMKSQGGGTIVNVSSMVSKAYYSYLGAYASTKYALNALSLTARAELENDNIIIGVVHPGLTDTDFGVNAIKSDETARSMQSRRREGMPVPDSPEHVAEKILFAIESGQAEVTAH